MRVAGARHDAFAEFDVPGLQTPTHAFDIGGGEGDVVEAAGVFVFLVDAAHHYPFARLARAHQMHGRGAAGIKPIAGKIERRTVAILEAEHVAVELLGLFQIGRFDRVVL